MPLLDWDDDNEESPIFLPHEYPLILPGLETKAYSVVFDDHDGSRLLCTSDSLDDCFKAIRDIAPYSHSTQDVIAGMTQVDYGLATVISVKARILIHPYCTDELLLMEPRDGEICCFLMDSDQLGWTERGNVLRREERARERREAEESVARILAGASKEGEEL